MDVGAVGCTNAAIPPMSALVALVATLAIPGNGVIYYIYRIPGLTYPRIYIVVAIIDVGLVGCTVLAIPPMSAFVAMIAAYA